MNSSTASVVTLFLCLLFKPLLPASSPFLWRYASFTTSFTFVYFHMTIFVFSSTQIYTF